MGHNFRSDSNDIKIIRPSRCNTRIPAHTMLEGTFDYVITPLEPPGTKVIVNKKPDIRRKWVQHGLHEWYISPEVEHYRCYKVYIPNKKPEHIADTMELFYL